MSANAFSQKDYENETAFRLRKNKPNQTQFRLPQRHAVSYAEGGKTEVRRRFSEVRYLFSAFCFLSYVHGHQTLAIGFASFIHVNSAGCLFYHFNGLGYLLQLWDLEYFAALSAVYPSVRGTAIKQPGTAAFRALSDNLHRYIPYTNSRFLNKERLLDLTLSQNILPTESIVIHRKLPSCPIIWFLPKRYHLIYKEQKYVTELGEIFLDLDA